MMDPVTEAVPPLGLARYRALFHVPHVRRLVLSGLLARLPMGMIGLALLLLVRENGGSYSAAGAVSGAYFVATAVGAPIAGRLVDRRGQTRILLRRALIFPALLFAVCALALVDAPIAAVAVCAGAAGALMPPVGFLAARPLAADVRRRGAACRRLCARSIAAGDHVHRRPTARRAPHRCRLACSCSRRRGGDRRCRDDDHRARPSGTRVASRRKACGSILGALESRGVTTIISLSVCLGVAFGATEVGFPAFAEGHGGAELGSIPLALFAGGSLVGGLIAGAHVTVSPVRLLRFSSLLLVVGIALPLLGWSLPSMAVLAFLAGVPIAPVVMSAYGLVDAVAKRGTAAEAFAWITTAVFVGFSAGMALGGSLIDAFGVRASFGFAVAATSVGAILVALGPGLEEA